MNKEELAAKLDTYGDPVLTFALLGVAAILIAVALLPKHSFIKAMILTWVLLP